jgi:hypothetical protein
MDRPELSLFVECHEFVCTIDTRSIERLVLPYEVIPVSRDGPVPVVQVGSRAYASFNLGRLLAMRPTQGASILVRTVFGGIELPLCFETGPCLVVRAPEPTVKLLGGLFNARRRAIGAAFVLPAAMAVPGRSPVGLTVDLDELVTAAERDSAARSLRELALPVATAP